MKDTRDLGVSYGYVRVPDGGVKVDGVSFPAGPRAAGKAGWYKLLLTAGCEQITQAEYEAGLETEAGQVPAKETGDARPGNRRRNKVKAQASG